MFVVSNTINYLTEAQSSITGISILIGKCQTCFDLMEARKKMKSVDELRYLSRLHLYHKSKYMGERMGYAQRVAKAETEPHAHCSLISDGMAQCHSKLPWYANMKETDCLDQHLQGVLNHGRDFTVYRTFDNIPGGANLAIYCFLSSLETTYKAEGKLPDTVFQQVLFDHK